MSTTDKAQQKLVDSMRKTKARGGTPAPAKKAEETKPAVSRSKKKVSATKAAKKSPKPAAATARQTGADPYQASRRVWPD